MSQTPLRQVRSRRNQIAGAIFVAIALAFAWEATNYQLGTAFRMGPGFIPITLAAILALLGVVVFTSGLRTTTSVNFAPIPWLGMALITGAVIVFGMFGPALGLVPSVLLCTFVIALASSKNTVVAAAAIAMVMAFLCWLIFKIGLGITLPSFGTLFS